MSSTDEKDRMSSIPEQLLSHILSFLDMKEAVCTCIVSRRWRYQWLFVLSLNLDVSLWRTRGECAISDFGVLSVWVSEKDKEFVQFVSNVLSSLPKGSSIHKFKLCNWWNGCFQVNTWIKSAAARNVQELHFERVTLYPTAIIGQIMTLKLIRVSFERKFCFSDEELALNIPTVQNLVLHHCDYPDDDVNTFTILAPQLKHLSLRVREVFELDTYEEPTIKIMKIHAPNLISLHVKGTFSHEISFLCDIPSLVVAEIDIVPLNLKDSESRGINVSYLMKIINRTCYAKSLTLPARCFQSCPKLVLENLKLNQIEYQNVKYLNLTEWHMGGDIRAVIKFLERFPNLESLALKGTSYQAKFGSLNFWTPPLEASYKFYHLKGIKVQGFCRRDNMLKFLEYLVRNAMQLESITLLGGEYLSTYEEEQLVATITKSLTSWGVAAKVPSAEVKTDAYDEKHKKEQNGKNCCRVWIPTLNPCKKAHYSFTCQSV